MMRSKVVCVKNQPQEVFYKKGVLKDFAKFTRKHLCRKKETLVQVFFCCSSDTNFAPRKDLSKTSLFDLKETLTSFHSAFSDIARSTIDSATDFDNTSEFMSLVPTCTMELSGLPLINGFL